MLAIFHKKVSVILRCLYIDNKELVRYTLINLLDNQQLRQQITTQGCTGGCRDE